MSVHEFRFPELGEGLHEGRIDRWLVKAGDVVREDDILAEVENDKAMVELPSPVDGKVLDIKVPDGTTVTVGDLIITFAVEGAGNISSAPEQDVQTAAVDQAGLGQVQDKVVAVQISAPLPAPVATESVVPDDARDVLAAPGVRRFAREQGVDITRVHGSGANGKVTVQDVGAFLAGAQRPAVTGQVPQVVASEAAPLMLNHEETALEERIPLTAIRRLIAQAMVKSKYTAPHVTVMDEANVTELVAFRGEVKSHAAERGVKMTYLPFVVKALVAAARRYPHLNATFDEERQEIILKHYYHIGIATDTERGLLVPVVRDADRKNMWAIASEINDLATRARTNKLTATEMKGSTISITNIGSAGGMFFTPIINYPEVAILGVGRITERPVMKDGQVVGAHMMALSLSFDHRIIDGALAQHFVNAIKSLLENPRLMLMEV